MLAAIAARPWDHEHARSAVTAALALIDEQAATIARLEATIAERRDAYEEART